MKCTFLLASIFLAPAFALPTGSNGTDSHGSLDIQVNMEQLSSAASAAVASVPNGDNDRLLYPPSDMRSINKVPTDLLKLILSYLPGSQSKVYTHADQPSLFALGNTCARWRDLMKSPTTYHVYSAASARNLVNVVFAKNYARAVAVKSLVVKLGDISSQHVDPLSFDDRKNALVATAQASAGWLGDLIKASRNLESLDISAVEPGWKQRVSLWNERDPTWGESQVPWSRVTSIITPGLYRFMRNVKDILIVVHSNYLAIKHTDLVELLQSCGNLTSLIIDGIIRENFDARPQQFLLPSVASKSINTITIKTQIPAGPRGPDDNHSVNDGIIPALLRHTADTLRHLALYTATGKTLENLPPGLLSLHLEWMEQHWVSHPLTRIHSLAPIGGLLSLKSLYLGQSPSAVEPDLNYLSNLTKLETLEIWSATEPYMDFSRRVPVDQPVVPFSAIGYQIEHHLPELKVLVVHTGTHKFWPNITTYPELMIERRGPRTPNAPVHELWAISEPGGYKVVRSLAPSSSLSMDEDPTVDFRALCARRGITLHIEI